jgi:hypothetical protein
LYAEQLDPICGKMLFRSETTLNLDYFTSSDGLRAFAAEIQIYFLLLRIEAQLAGSEPVSYDDATAYWFAPNRPGLLDATFGQLLPDRDVLPDKAAISGTDEKTSATSGEARRDGFSKAHDRDRGSLGGLSHGPTFASCSPAYCPSGASRTASSPWKGIG